MTISAQASAIGIDILAKVTLAQDVTKPEEQLSTQKSIFINILKSYIPLVTLLQADSVKL